jgi:ribosomal protein L11 methyltransferase
MATMARASSTGSRRRSAASSGRQGHQLDWLEITVVTAPEDVEAVSDLLREHTGAGLAIEGNNDSSRSIALKAYLPQDSRLSPRRRNLRRALSRLDVTVPLTVPRARTVREEDWANAWKEHFRVQRIGRIVVRPPWRRYRAREGEMLITLDPGMAFGTGQHPTTRMCLLALQEHVKAGERLLDVGTGSGILAIAAALLGASEVVGIDIDPLAVEIAGANVTVNAVQNRVRVAEGSVGAAWPFDRLDPVFHCVVANLISATIVELAGGLIGALKESGTGIVSGISKERVEECCWALRDAGGRVTDTMAEGDWRALIFERVG